jgi:GT2 family glycosyltransferase
MADELTVSVVIVNFNGREFLPEAIESLTSQTVVPAEIIVVDNASTDGSQDMIRERYPGVILLELEENTGFAAGTNIGFRHASGEFIALLNSDATAEPHWIEAMTLALGRWDDAAASVGKIFVRDDPGRIEQAGAEFNQLGNYWGRGQGEMDEGQFDREGEVPGVTGCAMMIRRDAVRDGEFFDPSLFMYGEELDLTIRLRLRDYRIIMAPDAVVLHRGMMSVSKRVQQPRLFQQFHSNRNRLKLIARYYPLTIILRSLPLLLISLAYWNLFFLREGGIRFALRAISEQVEYLMLGLKQRERSNILSAEKWTKWMTRQTFNDLLYMKRRMEQLYQDFTANGARPTSRVD